MSAQLISSGHGCNIRCVALPPLYAPWRLALGVHSQICCYLVV